MKLELIQPSSRMVEITDPGTGAPIGLRIEVLSIEDDNLEKLKRNFNDENLRLQSKNKHMKSEQIENNSNTLLFHASKGWEWYNPTGNKGDKGYDAEAMPEFKGGQPEYNQRNFIDLITTIKWARAQLTEEIADEKAFFEVSKTI